MAKQNNYQEFNKFQSHFYTNPTQFKEYSFFEVKRLGYVLLNNIAKGFPNFADIILNLKGIDWSGPESLQLLIALQHKFKNNFSGGRIPKFIYWKQRKPEKTKKKSRKTKKGLEFSEDIRSEIMSILKYDSKTYEYLKYSQKIQYIGKQLIGEFVQREKIKTKRKK